MSPPKTARETRSEGSANPAVPSRIPHPPYSRTNLVGFEPDNTRSGSPLDHKRRRSASLPPPTKHSLSLNPSLNESPPSTTLMYRSRASKLNASSQSDRRSRRRSPTAVIPALLAFPLLLLLLHFRSSSPTFLNLLLASAAVATAAAALYLLRPPPRRQRPVEWFIGNSPSPAPVPLPSPAVKDAIREGVELYSNGDLYEGEFHRGRCSGVGVYTFLASKGRYEGDWIGGKYDGYGVESWARGSRYRGQYSAGLRHGFGVYRFYNGDCYAGEWAGGQSCGVGSQTCCDGSCYVGEFKRGVKHGIGCYRFRNGDQYSGEYFADKIHGFGVYHFANRHCYEGSWHEGRKQGFGMYTFRTGDQSCGEWDSGVLRSLRTPSDPAVHHAVQAARKAACDAVLIPRIEEQVNKAVAAANKAAAAARIAAIKAVQNQMDGEDCAIDV